MLAKRIIPCLDIRDGQTVKGVNFLDIREVGDPVEMGAEYAREGADELVYLDITATHEGRNLFADLVQRIAANINIPFTVGGGIRAIADVDPLLSAGADKVTVNSAAVKEPELISAIARSYGSQFVVVAIDARFEDDDWFVYVNGGRIRTEKKLFEWAAEAERRGAGEILFTSMNHDGTKSGYANEATAQLSNLLGIPVIASGGAGEMSHFVDVFGPGNADAALAASIFHFQEIGIRDLKDHLREQQISIR
jgi:imidazole glycerol-phosphate synthase subunit HisF